MDPFWHPAKPQDMAVGSIGIKFVECPCRNVVCNTNCIMRRACNDGAHFYFRSNGNEMWGKLDFDVCPQLASCNPPFLGVVGPICLG